jgi:hypothetical protein
MISRAQQHFPPTHDQPCGVTVQASAARRISLSAATSNFSPPKNISHSPNSLSHGTYDSKLTAVENFSCNRATASARLILVKFGRRSRCWSGSTKGEEAKREKNLWNFAKTTPKKLAPLIAGRGRKCRQQFGLKNPAIAEENNISHNQNARKPQKPLV